MTRQLYFELNNKLIINIIHMQYNIYLLYITLHLHIMHIKYTYTIYIHIIRTNFI